MIGKMAGFGLLSLWSAAASAQGTDQAPPPSPYRQVMDAQYAAKAPVKPERPEEAQRSYDAYLKSIGKPAKDPDAGDNTVMPSR